MSGRAARQITGRILIIGRLALETPAHFGNGDVVGVTDMPLLRDPRDGVTPLLTGASIAGALRAYLREIERGYGEEGRTNDLAGRLFGSLEGRRSMQSWLLVDDALGNAAGIELRDGVAIDAKTRTAEDRKKYDIELLAAGTSFEVQLEFLESNESRNLLPALATALDGLAKGEIGLGMRKRRGFGRCSVTEWRVRRYDLTRPAELVAWLEGDARGEGRGKDIFALLGVSRLAEDRRRWFRMEATFRLPGSLLIRSATGQPGSPDMVHLKSQRPDGVHPVVSGTSLAGALRGRALRIANTALDEEKGRKLVDDMFGPPMEESGGTTERARSAAGRPLPGSSRVLVEESLVKGGLDLVQSRVKIDRFTGGAFSTALFSEQPLFGNDQAEIEITVALRNPQEWEIGLLLLALKDLWTGDLPLGGESSVGRGRLQGERATLTLHQNSQELRWQLEQAGDGLRCEPSDGFAVLEKYVAALWHYAGTNEQGEGA
ncbi:MAG: RAMP superfamily CRISPR-associated protein [Anaerolineae bacterium]